MNQELPNQGLVVWTGGNVSGIVRDAGHVVIKPSGVRFEALTPEKLVITDMDGNLVEGDFKPSVDLDIHIYLYKHRPDIGGICHTHAPYSSSFALLGEDIPTVTTPLAHLLGADVPCTRYATPGFEDTGEAIMESIGDGYAILVRNHGPFTVGPTPTHSVKIAVYMEEAAKTIHLAQLRGKVEPLPEGELERSFYFYRDHYGQKK